MKNLLFVFALCLTLQSHASQLYQVTLLRAAPGNMPELLEEAKQLRKDKKGDLVIMRHSQGDQWDLMLMAPAGKSPATQHQFKSFTAFQHDFLAQSDKSWKQVRKNAENNKLYHIEMFHAAAGKKQALIKQREMENAYYHATQRAGNMIFTTTFGSDVDVFTVGFYTDLITFATDPDLPDAVFEKAAIDAGFKSRSTIGLYLRELMSSHHDTLATRVDP